MSINIDPRLIEEPVHGHDSNPNKGTAPTSYQCYILRALSKGDRLFVERNISSSAKRWEIWGKEVEGTERKGKIVEEVLMSGGMEPTLWDVIFLTRRGYLEERGGEYVLTDKGRLLVAQRSSYSPPREYAEEETEL